MLCLFLINEVIILKFCIDSGVSDVMIPEDVAMTLQRAGTIKASDFRESKPYELADGSQVVEHKKDLRSIVSSRSTVATTLSEPSANGRWSSKASSAGCPGENRTGHSAPGEKPVFVHGAFIRPVLEGMSPPTPKYSFGGRITAATCRSYSSTAEDRTCSCCH